MAKDKSSKKQAKADVKRAKKIAAALAQAKDSNERVLHEEGRFSGPGARARALQRRFDSTGEIPTPKFATMPMADTGEDEDGAVS